MSRFAGEVVSVSELIERAREALDREVGMLAVEGEVFEYRGPHSSGHYYFKLRDPEASIDVKMWRGVAARGLRTPLEEGRAVLAIGRFDVWPKRGSLSFLLEEVHDLGSGDLARRFEEQKQRLRREGLFDAERKRPVPLLPRRVGLITAVPSAAAADVERTWAEVAAPFTVERIPARVQGASAPADLARALRLAAEVAVDVILLSRGGGSLEDLWAFNEEQTVRAIAACPVPVVVAVGHETDTTLADYVADASYKTPTAGAAALAAGWLAAREQLGELRRRTLRAGARLLAGPEAELRQAATGLDGRMKAWLRSRHHAWVQARLALQAQRPDRRVERARRRLHEAEYRLVDVTRDRLRRQRGRLQRQAQAAWRLGAGAAPARARARLDRLAARLEAASPTALLARGYALVSRPGQPGFLRSSSGLQPGELLRITLAQGAVEAAVTAVDPTASSPAAESGAPGGADLRD